MIQLKLGGIIPPSNPISKRCGKCGLVKPLDAFSASKQVNNYCKMCFAEYMRERRSGEVIEHVIPSERKCTFCGICKSIDAFCISRKSKTGHTSRCKVRINSTRSTDEYRSKVKLSNRKRWAKLIMYSVRSRTRNTSIPVNITEDDIFIPEFCPVLGISLTIGDGIHSPNTATLDRLNPKLGYVKGNVVVISWLANNRKGDCTDPAVFDAIAAYIRRNT